ncbi:MAG: hypothetical protein NC093_10260 [Alistipes sp.]|nr:hypothetical protein [Alistipes sp.]
MLKKIIERNQKKYMSVKLAAELWGVSVSTVRSYCREGRVKDCFKLNEKNWYIYIDEIKPLTNVQIHQLLVLTIQLKNDPSLTIDWSVIDIDRTAILKTYNYLKDMGYVKHIPTSEIERIPYEIILTNKGLDVATTFKREESKAYKDIVTQWVPVILQIGELLLSVKQLIC